MPTIKFNGIEEVYKVLTDFEIEDDSKGGVPLAEIKVKGLHLLKVSMVSEWNFYKYLQPLKDQMLAYYARSILNSTEQTELDRATEKIKIIQQELTDINAEQLRDKTAKLSYFFEDYKMRLTFFKGLKKLGIVKWWVSWKRWQKCVSRHHTLTIFIMLWAFNFDGFKKKTTRLLQSVNTIYAHINSQSPTDSSSYTDFDTFRKMHQKGHERVLEKLHPSSNN